MIMTVSERNAPPKPSDRLRLYMSSLGWYYGMRTDVCSVRIYGLGKFNAYA